MSADDTIILTKETAYLGQVLKCTEIGMESYLACINKIEDTHCEATTFDGSTIHFPFGPSDDIIFREPTMEEILSLTP